MYARVVHQLELGAGGVATVARRERIVEVRVVDTGEHGGDAVVALGMARAGVVRVRSPGDDSEEASRHDPQSGGDGRDRGAGLRRSMTRGIRRRRPSRRPASMSPSTTPTSAPTSISTRRIAGSSPAKNASAARSMMRCTRKPGRIEPERSATYPRSTARLRNGTRLAAPVI